MREILVIHSNLYNRILVIIKIGYNAQQKLQINVIPSLSKAHGGKIMMTATAPIGRDSGSLCPSKLYSYECIFQRSHFSVRK